MEFSKALDFLKLKPRYIFAACIATVLFTIHAARIHPRNRISQFREIVAFMDWCGVFGECIASSSTFGSLGVETYSKIINTRMESIHLEKATKSSYAKGKRNSL